ASRSRRNRSGGASFADTSPHLPPSASGDFRGIAYSTRYAPGLVEMASCGRTAELLTRFLSLSAIRFATHRGVKAMPQPTSGQEKGANTEQYQPTVYCFLHAISLPLDSLR